MERSLSLLKKTEVADRIADLCFELMEKEG
jgi:hypothetical protein